MPENLEITCVLCDWDVASDTDRKRMYTYLYAQLQQIARRQLAQERDDVILEPSMQPSDHRKTMARIPAY